MFICTIRANTVKFIGVLGAAVLSLVLLVLLIPGYEPAATSAIAQENAKYTYDKVKTPTDAAAFLRQFGWEVEDAPLETVTIRIPREFDKVMNAYNELQKNQGLDLSKYRDKDVTRYTFRILNYPEYNGDVTANVIVYKNRVVGGDVCSADVTGFITGFFYPTGK